MSFDFCLWDQEKKTLTESFAELPMEKEWQRSLAHMSRGRWIICSYMKSTACSIPWSLLAFSYQMTCFFTIIILLHDPDLPHGHTPWDYRGLYLAHIYSLSSSFIGKIKGVESDTLLLNWCLSKAAFLFMQKPTRRVKMMEKEHCNTPEPYFRG